MKKLTPILLAILAVTLPTTAAVAGSTEWLCGEKQITSKDECLTDSENLEALKFYDLGASSGVECAAGSVVGEGWSGPGSEDEVTTLAFVESSKNCKPMAKGLNAKGEEVTNACKKVEAVEAIHLPWATLIEESKWDLLFEDGAHGLPGYLLLCEIVGGTRQNDECTFSSSDTPLAELENLPGSGAELSLVTSRFVPLASLLNKAELANCNVGGSEEGLIEGENLLIALTEEGGKWVEEALEISEGAELEHSELTFKKTFEKQGVKILRGPVLILGIMLTYENGGEFNVATSCGGKEAPPCEVEFEFLGPEEASLTIATIQWEWPIGSGGLYSGKVALKR